MFEAYRLYRLRRTIAWAKENSRFYRRHFAHVDPRDLRTLGDLALLPLTMPEDLAAAPFDFLCTSQSEAMRAVSFETSGTTGPGKRVFFGAQELDDALDFMAAGMRTVAGPLDVVQVMLPKGFPYGQCDMLVRAVERMGARAVAAGSDADAREQRGLIEKHGSTVLFCETMLLYRISKVLARDFDLRSLPVHTLFVTTSLASKNVVEFLERTWGARVASHYGMTEACFGLAVSCPVCGGRHYNELDAIVEVVDAHTGAPLPAGHVGELALTTLNRSVMPLIRYCTHDRLAHTRPLCTSESLPSVALGEVAGRSDTVVELKGGFDVVPTSFDDALLGIEWVVDYRVRVLRAHGADILQFHIEPTELGSFDEEVVRAALRAQLDAWHLGSVDVGEVRCAGPGSLFEAGRVKRRVLVGEHTG